MPDEPSLYCLVPPALADELLEPLREHFAADPTVRVIVDRRRPESAESKDDRVQRVLATRHAEQRAPHIPRLLAGLPEGLQPHAQELRFVQRMAPVGRHLEDAPIETVVAAIAAGDVTAPTELWWRTYERVRRRLELRLHNARAAEAALPGAYGRVFDMLSELGNAPFDAWLDALVDDYAGALERG